MIASCTPCNNAIFVGWASLTIDRSGLFLRWWAVPNALRVRQSPTAGNPPAALDSPLLSTRGTPTGKQILQEGNPPSGLSHRALFVAPLHERGEWCKI